MHVGTGENQLSKAFEQFILMVIFVNCITLALDYPPPLIEWFFAVIFSVEFIGKAITYGLVLEQHSYLRNPWNCLDFVVVVSSWVALLPSIGNFSAIRALRSIRVLRTVKIVPGLNMMATALIGCMKKMGAFFFLMGFMTMIFAVIGVQVFEGVLRQKCVSIPGPNMLSAITAANGSWSFNEWVYDPTNWILNSEGDGYQICGNSSSAFQCERPANSSNELSLCLTIGDNPNEGHTSFDNIGIAALVVFQVITLDFWEDVYDKIVMAAGSGSVFYFVAAVYFGAFMLLNLLMAIVLLHYTIEMHRTEQLQQMESYANPEILHFDKAFPEENSVLTNDNTPANDKKSPSLPYSLPQCTQMFV